MVYQEGGRAEVELSCFFKLDEKMTCSRSNDAFRYVLHSSSLCQSTVCSEIERVCTNLFD